MPEIACGGPALPSVQCTTQWIGQHDANRALPHATAAIQPALCRCHAMCLQLGTGAGGSCCPSRAASARCTLSRPPEDTLPARAGTWSADPSRAALQGPGSQEGKVRQGWGGGLGVCAKGMPWLPVCCSRGTACHRASQHNFAPFGRSGRCAQRQLQLSARRFRQ